MRQTAAILVGLALLVTGPVGCVERTLQVTSDPPGALVYMSGVEIGRTPVTRSFTWYGDYEIVLRREGYETLKTHYKLTPPLYEIPPFDLLSELAPWTYRDQRAAHFSLTPRTELSEQQLIDQANLLRTRLDEPRK